LARQVRHSCGRHFGIAHYAGPFAIRGGLARWENRKRGCGMKRALLPILLLVWTSSALGQIPSSSHEVVGTPRAKDYVDGAIELKRLAGCAVRKKPAYARSMVASLPGSSVEFRVGQAVMKVMEPCMIARFSAMRIGFAQLRGALAEEMYLMSNPNTPNFESFDHSAMALPKEWVAAKLEGYALSEVVAHDFAQCTVAADPVLADALLRTIPRSREEDAQIAKLMPVLGPCLMQGYKFQMDAAAVRSYMAQALYRGMAMWPVSNSSNSGQN